MKEFLSSKNVSLGCTAINAVCAVAAALSGSWIWFGVSTGLAALCYHNYMKKHGKMMRAKKKEQQVTCLTSFWWKIGLRFTAGAPHSHAAE